MLSNNSPSSVFSDIFPPRQIRILGAGRFGKLAAERLRRRFPDAILSITERDAAKADELSDLGIAIEMEDSVQNICRVPPADDAWLVPAVPVHVGFEWLLNTLKRTTQVHRLPVPKDVDPKVPNPIRTASGTIYTSFATFICPDYCSEPGEICTKTGKMRPGNLYEVLNSVFVPGYDVAVLRSWQLAPGVGGYPGISLRELHWLVGSKPGRYLIATSCRCHGVVNALEWKAEAVK